MIVRDLMACFGVTCSCLLFVWLIVAVAVIDESVREIENRKSCWGRPKHRVVALAKRVDEPGNLLFWSCSSSS